MLDSVGMARHFYDPAVGKLSWDYIWQHIKNTLGVCPNFIFFFLKSLLTPTPTPIRQYINIGSCKTGSTLGGSCDFSYP